MSSTEANPGMVRRTYSGPALLRQGFRPFFLGAGLWAAASLALWIVTLASGLALPTAFQPLDWHTHELLFGYTGAVIAGFLLTAVPNWTGRLPISGTPLAMLALAWLAGRAAVLVSAYLPAALMLILDLAFPVLLCLAIGRELVAGRNLKNFRVLAVVSVFALANLAFHLEAMIVGRADVAVRLGLAAVILLIMLIGGRVVPSFTRNWLARRAEGRLPIAFGRFDGGAIALSALALFAWTVYGSADWVGAAFILAGVVNAVRLWRWAGERTFAEALVWVLHLGYLFVPLGFLAIGLSILAPDLVPPAGAMHLWTAGAIGMMTMAIMTRASLGHSGQALTAGPRVTAIYVLVLAAVLARFAASYGYGYEPLLHLAGLCWIAGFLLFVAVFAPLLLGRRA